VGLTSILLQKKDGGLKWRLKGNKHGFLHLESTVTESATPSAVRGRNIRDANRIQ
jgi:hypothetical protein